MPDRPIEAKLGVDRKTATAVLLEKAPEKRGGWRILTFGDNAELEYIDAKSGGGERADEVTLFKYFKMELFKGGQKGIMRSSVDDAEGNSMDEKTQLPLVDVVSLALEHFKDVIINRLNPTANHTLRASDIRWVLTVPAIWSSFGKAFMRAAAHRAGLITDENDMEVRWGATFPQVALTTQETFLCRQSN